MMRFGGSLLLLLLPLAYQSFRTGNADDVTTAHPQPGFALIGGGQDVDEINHWFISKASHGDLLVLRASGTDAYNPYSFNLVGAPHLNSVETLVIPSIQAAQDPYVLKRVAHAAAIFISGGDQWNYVHLWNQSPLGDALRHAVQRGIPIAGTSAGLAIMGEYIFTAEKDTVTSAQALPNPYNEHVTIGHQFLAIPALRNTITDSHFHARDRLGRTLVFLARMLTDFHLPEARAIAIDERTAALLEPDGKISVAGLGHIYFIRIKKQAPITCLPQTPLSMSGIEVYRSAAGSHFDTTTWQGTGGDFYHLSVSAGTITSDRPDHSLY